MSVYHTILSYQANSIGKLHAVQQALATKLHLTDTDVAQFVGDLLDDIEGLKVNNTALTSEQGQAILNDEDVAQAYVENFAMKVFAKADKDIYNKTTTKGTGVTFIAAATFLDLLRVFQNPLDKDYADKIRYAKYHASRIIKAFKTGEDPNLYDPPVVENEEEQVNDLMNKASLEAQDEAPTESTADPDASQPFDLPSAASHDPTGAPLDLPSAAAHDPNEEPFRLPSAASHHPDAAPSPFGTGNLPSAPSFTPDITRSTSSPSPPPTKFSPPPAAPRAAASRAPPPLQTSAPASHGHHLTKQEVQTIMDETEVISTAQKHAKFAISALNYEDMSTAIRELTAALDLLKAHGGKA